MIHVHLADRGTTTFTGDFSKTYEAAQAYIRAHATSSPEQIDDDRPEGVNEKDWRYYSTPSKARIAGVIQSAGRPLLGEVRNVGPKFRAKWERV